jgi:hypothetical protein
MKMLGWLMLVALAGCTSAGGGSGAGSTGSDFETARPADMGQADSCSGQPWSWCTGYREKP